MIDRGESKARAIARKIEWHYTPEHASWLNIAEIELSAFSTQCLNQKIGDKTELQKLASVWTKERNERCVKVEWQFRTDDTRLKLKRLYLTFESRQT
jgi:predicted AAA+ superfamily ATPase